MLRNVAMLIDARDKNNPEYHKTLTVQGDDAVSGQEKAAEITPAIRELWKVVVWVRLAGMRQVMQRTEMTTTPSSCNLLSFQMLMR